MDHSPTTYTIDRIIKWVTLSKLALPEFQRDFVWNPSKVAELLDSIARGWPVGSLLILEGPQPFQAKAIDSAPPIASGEIEKYILDGQQRVTALYHAVTDSSDIVYFIDFHKLHNDDEDYIVWMRRELFEETYPNIRLRAQSQIAKICEIYDAEQFYTWQSNATAEVSQLAATLRERRLVGLRSQVYKFTAVVLECEIELEALARIFETINRTGVRLNAFDLMVAVLYPHKFNLREEWELAVEGSTILRVMETDGIEILKLIALWERDHQRTSHSPIRKKVAGVRQGDVLAVPPQRVKADWKKAVPRYEDALKMLSEKYGIQDSATLPSTAMILTLAFALELDVDTELIDRWYWSSIVRQTYSQGANTRVTHDVDAFIKGEIDVLYRMTDKDHICNLLLEPVQRNRILLCGIMGIMGIRAIPDPLRPKTTLNGQKIAARPMSSLSMGQTRPNSRAPIADLIFMTERNLREAAAQVRSGLDIWDVLDADALKKQGVTKSALAPTEKTRMARAKFLAQMIVKATKEVE